MAADGWIVDFLQSGPRLELEGDRLTLVGEDATVVAEDTGERLGSLSTRG
jgi:hypothetical protein